MEQITTAQAVALTTHEMVWRATLRTGEIIHEQPGLSSDHLPRDEIVRMEYVPGRNHGPVIECSVDLGRGERFQRYWTTIWRNGGGQQRLYVVGVERGGRHALLIWYPRSQKVAFADHRGFAAPWEPKPFYLLPTAATLLGGPGTTNVGWVHEGFGGQVHMSPGHLKFQAIYA